MMEKIICQICQKRPEVVRKNRRTKKYICDGCYRVAYNQAHKEEKKAYQKAYRKRKKISQ